MIDFTDLLIKEIVAERENYVGLLKRRAEIRVEREGAGGPL
jgi:hypothetical protein